MHFYVCSFLYVGDRSSHSANIPDQVGHICIIQSDMELKAIKLSEIKNYYRIQELLEENDCEDIKLDEIDFEDVKDDYSEEEVIIFNRKDL